MVRYVTIVNFRSLSASLSTHLICIELKFITSTCKWTRVNESLNNIKEALLVPVAILMLEYFQWKCI